MTSEDQLRLQQLAADLPAGTRLHLTLTRHAHSAAFETYGRQLQALAPDIDLVPDRDGAEGPPWMESRNGIRFHALPEGDKLESFVRALTPPGDTAARLPQQQQDLLERMPLPATVRLFIAPGCPHCPKAIAQWTALARAGKHLRLHVIDAVLFPEMAREEAIKAVPTLVVDGHLRWSGRIPVAEVLEQLISRDPGRLSAEALDGIIKEGQAAQVARSMIDKGTLFPAITDLLTHAKWPVRLGAMVVMEEVAAADRRLSSEVIPILQDRYARLEQAVQGDVLYIMGETGDHRVLPFLREVMQTSPHHEVRQAALEALTAIQERSGIHSINIH
jgi:hypothetical protein